MKQAVLLLISWYQKYLSLDTGVTRFIFPGRKICRFTPTCSAYTYDAVKLHGIIKGLFLGARRVIRCHPWNTGGFDPVKRYD